MLKARYGQIYLCTGCFALMNIGSDFRLSRNRLLTTPAYRLNGKMTYALEGSIFIAGAAIQWLRDGLEFFPEAAVSEAMAMSVVDNNEYILCLLLLGWVRLTGDRMYVRNYGLVPGNDKSAYRTCSTGGARVPDAGFNGSNGGRRRV